MTGNDVRDTDYKEALSAISRLVACDSPETLAATAVEEIGKLIPSHSCVWVDIQPDTGFSQGYMNVPVDPSIVAREMADVIHGHPVFKRFLRTGQGDACAISDEISRHRFQAQSFYTEYLQKYGVEDQLVMAALGENNRVIALTVNRTTWGFLDREKEVLNVLRPVLFRFHWLLRQLSESKIAEEGVVLQTHLRPILTSSLRAKGLHRREAEVLAILAEGKTNREIARELSICEGTVRKHINRIFLKLDVHSRAGATRAALSLLHEGHPAP